MLGKIYRRVPGAQNPRRYAGVRLPAHGGDARRTDCDLVVAGFLCLPRRYLVHWAVNIMGKAITNVTFYLAKFGQLLHIWQVFLTC